ncbi:MAG: AsmA-like C-terminal domain-containing protein, partial [Rhodospirillaceae bacterium]|nr:AsmA-like C-terminal domain-containing protein [Rhodospirillaceae bacterium]
GAAPLVVRYGPMGDGRDQLSVQADDAAAAFAALDMLHAVSGGRLLLTAINAGGTWSGRARVEQLWLTQAPVLARLLANGPLLDLSDRLEAEGLMFDMVEVPFTLSDGRLYLTDMRASGGALGLTAEGVIDRIAETVDVHGTIVPLAGVNQVLGEIPVLGTILTGGDDQGLLALTFTVTGPIGDPAVNVNPLSALAPGIVRRILFEGGSDDDGPAVSEIDQNRQQR